VGPTGRMWASNRGDRWLPWDRRLVPWDKYGPVKEVTGDNLGTRGCFYGANQDLL
jgi:hypothetical protein